MQRRDFSARQREYWVSFLLARDGYFCVTCNRDVSTLIRDSKSDRLLPVLVIDHIDGDTRYTDSPDGIHGGNLRLLCYSCNRKNIAKVRPPTPERERTPEHKKSEESKPIFYNWLDRYLIDNKHICYKMMLNRGSKIANDSSQITVKRWYEQVYGLPDGYDEFQLHEVSLVCDYGKCDGTHVCFSGEIPRNNPIFLNDSILNR